MKAKLKPEDEAGIKAIMDLQKLVGIKEPRKKAERNWRAFSEYDKANTMAAWTILCTK